MSIRRSPRYRYRRHRHPTPASENVLDGTVPEVIAYLRDHPAELADLQAAEEQGQARKGILSLTPEDLTSA